MNKRGIFVLVKQAFNEHLLLIASLKAVIHNVF
jgi:hypothetical protein